MKVGNLEDLKVLVTTMTIIHCAEPLKEKELLGSCLFGKSCGFSYGSFHF